MVVRRKDRLPLAAGDLDDRAPVGRFQGLAVEHLSRRAEADLDVVEAEDEIEAPRLIRFGQLTSDEFFVSEQAATQGVVIKNPSRTDPIVMLKHFGPKNPELVI